MRNLTVIVVLCLSLIEAKASIIIGLSHEARIRALEHVPETNAVFPRYQRSVNEALKARGGWREHMSSSYVEVDASVTSAPPTTEHPAVGDGTQSRGGSTNTSSATTDEGLRGTDAVASQSALPGGASADAPKPEKLQVHAKEEKLRAALRAAEGPSKILREVERILALRRLLDSALRVTSATASDGRLAALALYPLGAAARAAETAAARPLLPPASASPATTVDASGAVESPASADQAREVHVQETEEAPPSSSSFGGVPADTADSSGATTALAAPELTRLPSASGEGLEPEDGGMPAECANEGEGGGGDGGGRCSGLEGVVEETTAVAGKGRSDIGRPTPATLPLSERGDDTSVSLPVERGNGDGDDTHEVDAMAHPSNAKFEEEDGCSEVGTVQYARDTVGSEGEIHASSAVAAAAAAASTASAPLSPAPAAISAAAAASAVFAFDVEGLKRDLRFEQLVEIVKCVALELSVSDISKVVWGLPILGNLPHNSFLESLAYLPTDRLHNECAYAALSPPADAAPSSPPPAGADVAHAASASKEEKDEVSAAGVDQNHPPSASTLPLGGAREQDDVLPPPASEHPTSDGPAASVAAVLEGDDAPGAAAAGVSRKDRDTPTVSSADGGGDTASVPEAAGGSPVLAMSGTDLATAALSFAYAHSRLDISTGELLEMIATCAIPQLASMPLRDLANIAWAFAVQRHLHHELLAGVAREVTSERTRRGGLDRMSVKDASVLAWSYGALGLRPPGLFATLAREGLSMVHEATAHDLSNLAWGLASAGLGVIVEDAKGETTDDGLVGDREGIHGGSSSPSSSIDNNSNIGRDTPRPEDHDAGAHSGDGTQAPDPASPPLPPDSSGEFKNLEGRGVSDEGGPWGLGWVLGKKAAAARRRGAGRRDHGRGVAAIPRVAVNEGFDAVRETREAGCSVGGDGVRDEDDGGDVAGVLPPDSSGEFKDLECRGVSNEGGPWGLGWVLGKKAVAGWRRGAGRGDYGRGVAAIPRDAVNEGFDAVRDTREAGCSVGGNGVRDEDDGGDVAGVLPPDSSGEFKDLEGSGVSNEGVPWGLGWVLGKKAVAGWRRGAGRGDYGRGVAAIPRDAVNEGFDAVRDTREAGCSVGGNGVRDEDDGGDVAGVLPPDSWGEFKDLEGRGVSNEGGPWGLGWVLGKKAAAGWRRGAGRGDYGRGVAAIPQDAVNEGFDAVRDTREAGCSVGGDGVRDGDDRGGVAGVLAGVQHEGEVDLVTSSQEDAAGVDVESPPLGQRLGEAVLTRASDCFGQFPPKHLSRLCWALGAWHNQGVVLPDAGLFAARALAEAGQHPKNYTAEELAQVLWSFATLVGNSDSPTQELTGLLGALAESFESEQAEGVAGRSSGLDAATACDVLWSFAKLGHSAHSLCEAMAGDLVDQVQHLPPSSVASLAWAYGMMRYPSAELMKRVLSVVEKRLGDFTVKDAASALWALGALGYTVSLKRSFDFSPEDLCSLNPSASANLLWGLVKTGAAFADEFNREDLEAVAADMGPKLHSFSPRELCRTAWALGRLGVGGVYFGGARAGDVGALEDDGVVPEGSGCDDDGSEMSRLVDKLLGECSKWLELFTPQELETLLWAVCRLEHRADDLVAKMAAEAKQRQEGLPGLLQRSGPSAARDAAFHLGSFRHLLTMYSGIGFDGQRARGRYRRGTNLLSRMFRER